MGHAGVEHAGEEAVVHELPKECTTVGTSGHGFGFALSVAAAQSATPAIAPIQQEPCS
jgi:hypothetical protein